ncbi:MAG: hypothetical protein J5821_02650 [Alphaproteobacteria bacterium]|nr:hypothetical protein [Alphaproteobacteria bacterium]
MRQISFKTIEKNLQKKNAELVELRDFRRKLDAKEKEICADIEKLQNEKVEFIFAQVKKEIKNENLDVSSGSILSLLEVLRKNQQIMNPETTSEEITDSDLKISVEAKDVHE